MNLRGWTAWAPGRETPAAWRAWALDAVPGAQREEAAAAEAEAPSVREIPPLLRRRADKMGRAALHVLSRPELPYGDQAIVLCSRIGEFSRSFALQDELAREGRVSPQQFSMAVHNAAGGLFMMARAANAPLSALAAGEEGALAGLQETLGLFADGAETVWLLYCDEPLPREYHSFASARELTAYFAFLLELSPGDEFHLAPEGGDEDGKAMTDRAASPLDLLAFFLRPGDGALRLSPRGGWMLRRTPRGRS
ncbi:MAG: beta-ketoacyl synthase chain length factor [Candidatus Accumulibacter sp.]|jgi:hypothetical protein|nr:beta-ketoacyl synthase chain length factor [Accumulibacter sp.]